MARYHQQFDAKRYWANKPYCEVCKTKKVKHGKICRECEKKAGFDETEMQINTEKIDEKDLVANFDSTEINREEADQRLISMVGYLKDCAQALLRSVALTDLSSNDVSFFPLSPDSLEKLTNDNLVLTGKDILDLLYKVTARPTEFELILGTLFVKGYKGNGNKITRINAPLLFVKLEAEKMDDDSVVFSIKEDTIHLNQSLAASIVNVQNEEELEIRFQDLWSATPEWPLTLESLKQFFESFNNYFPEIFHSSESVENFVDLDSISAEKEKYKICPAHCLIVAPKQEAQGTVVEEINRIFLEMKNNTAADLLFLENSIGQDPVSSIREQTTDGYNETNQKDEEEWHNLFPFDLSDTQKQIVLGARENKLSVVSGPPGTGKSYTIAAIILDHLLGGKRVLFVSRMDKAVEVVSNWLEEFVGPYAVARSGARKAQRALADKLDSITGAKTPVKQYTKEQIDSLLDEYSDAQEKLNELEEQFTQVLANERTWASVREKIDEIEHKIKTDKNLLELPINKNKAQKLQEKIRGADFLVQNKKFFIQTWWGNLVLSNIKKQLGATEETTAEELIYRAERIENERQRSEIEEEIEKFDEINQIWTQIQERKLKLRELSLNNLQAKLLGNLHTIVHNYDKRVELRNFIKSLRTANIREKLALLEKVNTETLLNSFPCWASTTYHLSQILPIDPGMFDLVIFDEASQCDLASALPALYRANRALIVGDPKQLTHVVFLGRQAEYSAFAKNNVPPEMQANYRFSTQSLFDVAENAVPQANYFMLDEHFRSDPHIIGFSNKMFYEENIRIMTHRPKLGITEDSTAIQVEYVDGKRTNGAANPKEIEHIFSHVKQLIAQSPTDKPTTIGILSPFRDQVNAITKELPNHINLTEVERHGIVVGTAHSLQGDEKDVVILSLSLDPNFHHGTLRFLETPNVFNVSITRAKRKLVVVSSVRSEDLPNGLLKEFLLHASKAVTDFIPRDVFESKFEEQVAQALEKAGFKIWPQYEAAGFSIDLAVGDGKNWIAVECDGPTHFDMKQGQNFNDVWRQGILERAGWKFVRISYRDWERDSDKQIEKVRNLLGKFSI